MARCAVGGAYQPPEKPAVKRLEDDESGNDPEKGMDENSNNVYLPASAQTESRLLADCKRIYSRACLCLYRSTYRPKLLDRLTL